MKIEGRTVEEVDETCEEGLRTAGDCANEPCVRRAPFPAPTRAELVLRTAILDLLCSSVVNGAEADSRVGARLRRALNESREPHEHPEDYCEECRRPFEVWSAHPQDWETVTSRNYGGPIFCRACFVQRLGSERALKT